ncbi:MAG: MBL fold metallo-hydrolase [Anaerolineales bacterium]|nr:MBL fold metallo-hydrolase [Anaerolineales bacterium]
MHIYHLNCGTLRPLFPKAEAIIYCLLVETSQGLVLVDTGFGTYDYSAPSPLMKFFLKWMGVACVLEETALHQISRLGFRAKDVGHLILTHLHFDHAGGLPDFPHAKVHVYGPEYRAAMDPHGLIEYAYDASHWAHEPDWVLHEEVNHSFYGLDCIQIMPGVDPEILMVPLTGHTRGHCGVAIRMPDGWLFQCGDAASPFHQDTDLHDRDKSQYCANILPRWFAYRVIGPHVPRLRVLVREHGQEVSVISSHDIYSFREYQVADKFKKDGGQSTGK